MAAKKAVEKTAASSRPRRTPKPTTTPAAPAAAASKPKKKATTKKAAPKKATPKKTAASKVTKKGPAARATEKALAATRNRGANPLGPAAAKKVADRKAAEREASALYSKLSARYSVKVQNELKEELKAAWARDEWLNVQNMEQWLEWNVQEDYDAWKEAEELDIGDIEAQYDVTDHKEMEEELNDGWKKGEFHHCVDISDYLYWLEAEKIKEKNRKESRIQYEIPGHKLDGLEYPFTKSADQLLALLTGKRIEDEAKRLRVAWKRGECKHLKNVGEWLLEEQKVRGEACSEKERREMGGKKTIVSASSSVEKLQETVVNASPVKQIQGLLGARAEGSQRREEWSNDSGYRADNEQSSVLSRTWDLAANAVEAMKGAVTSE